MNGNEGFNRELKRDITKTFLKTVSAFANYNDGQIIFGIDDDGNLAGIKGAEDECLRVEQMINDSMDPLPNFRLQTETIDEKKIITLTVLKGKDTPYYYRGKAYKRSDTSTVEVDRFELRHLAIEGVNIDYEEKKASSQDLRFAILEDKLKEKTGIERISLDVLKTLNLHDKDGYYNVAGELLADQNEVDFSGIDVVRFGKDRDTILYRETIAKKSLLAQYDRAIELFEQYYQYEKIDGYKRVKTELIPKEAFRESLANAIVHRVWDVNSFIQVSMYEDRLEIDSPGGLPQGISAEDYLYGNVSVLRNPIIAGVFYRLSLIEKFGTGIGRIKQEYRNSLLKPSFHIGANRVCIELPVQDVHRLGLTEEEEAILAILKTGAGLSRRSLDQKTGFNKAKTLRVIQSLLEKNLVEKQGKGPSTTYSLK